jgi:hypothetical protein
VIDEQIIDEIAGMLRCPDRREGQRAYRRWLFFEACTRKKKVDLAKGDQLLRLFRGHAGDYVLLYEDAKGAKLIAKADDGDVDADAVLCGIADRFMTMGLPFPPHLHSYVQQLLRRQSYELGHNEGGDKCENFIRNFTIAEAAVYLSRKHAIKIRNSSGN